MLGGARETLAVALLLYAGLKGAVLERGRGRRLVVGSAATQVYFTAVEPLLMFLLVAVSCGFFAIVLADRLMRPNGLAPYVPAVVTQSVVRELVPLLIALVVIGRSGPAIATELGYMRVNHEIDALEVAGMNIDYLVVLPRVVGVTLATLGLTVAMSAAALFGGYLLAASLDLVSVGLRFEQVLAALDLRTIGFSLAKACAFGLVISLVNCHYGLAVTSSFTEIPRANVRGAVACYLACFVLNGALSVLALTVQA